MTIESILEALDDSAKDIKLNVKSMLDETQSPIGSQTKAVVYAVAIALKPSKPMRHVIDQLQSMLDDQTIHAAKIASALMSMNNIYYRFSHLSEDEALMKMPAGLRMQSLRQHGVSDVLFELMTLAISALNGCGMCIHAHINALRKHQVGDDQIQMAGKIAGIMHALNQVTMLD